MKKFVLLTIGFTQPTPEIMESWMKWFKSIEDKIVEQVGLGNGKKVTKNSIIELPMDEDAITGYLVINVENTDEAIKIAQKCPMITSTLVYEVRSHE
jgi:transcription antitermination factor NusG